MNLLTRFGLARSRFTIAAMISLLLAGIVLYPNFPKREDPVIVIRTAVVSVLFPGMAPERIENLVAIPIDRRNAGAVLDDETQVTTTGVWRRLVFVRRQSQAQGLGRDRPDVVF